MTVIRVSRQELERLKVLVKLGDGRLDIDAAATLLGVGRRQLFRLRNAFQSQGAKGLVSRKRGRPSNRSHGATLRQTAIGLVRDRYADFGPTLAADGGLRMAVMAWIRLSAARPATYTEALLAATPTRWHLLRAGRLRPSVCGHRLRIRRVPERSAHDHAIEREPLPSGSGLA